MDQFRIKKDKNNEFLRPVMIDDIRYRRIKRVQFEDQLKNALPRDCDLCFHGTTIWNTRDIIKSGIISARIDREGYDFDQVNIPNQISVTTINNVWFTIKQFADLDNYKYPAGCIFVISPLNLEEIISSRDKSLIGNVDFRSRPDRIKAIITTPENIERVREWIRTSDISLDPKIVVDYDESIDYLKNINDLENLK